MIAPATFEAVRDDGSGDSFPRSVLERAESALCLFAAGFYGRQDAFWLAEAGLDAVVCVDVDRERLAAMMELYPSSWGFLAVDVYEYLEEVEAGSYDVVTVDCPTGHFERCRDLIPELCSIATKAVVLGSSYATKPRQRKLPRGWKLTDFRRRSDYMGGVYWAVLEREAA